MIESYTRLIKDRTYCTLNFHHQTQKLSIYIIDKQKEIILVSEVGKQELPSLLFKFFCQRLLQLYQFLTKDDCPIRIYENKQQIRIQYTINSTVKKSMLKDFGLPTKKYSQTNMIIQQDQFSTTQQISKEASKIQKNDIVDCQFNFHRFNNSQILKGIKPIENHPNWYLNQFQNVCIQLSDKLSTYKIDRISSHITYRLSINLNQYHRGMIPRYDLTIGFATHQKIAEIRVAAQPDFNNTISTSIDTRSITSQCITLSEKKIFENIIIPKQLELFVTINQGSSIRIENVKVIVHNENEQILVNIVNKQNLEYIKHNFIKLDEYFPFAYFSRSFLHFSFGSERR